MYYLCSLDPSSSMMLLLYIVIICGYYICWLFVKKMPFSKTIQANGMEIILYLTIILFYFMEISLVKYNEDYFFFKRMGLFRATYGLILLLIFILHRIKNFYKISSE